MLAAADESQRKYLELTHKMVAPQSHTLHPTPFLPLHPTPSSTSRTNKYLELTRTMVAPLPHMS